MSQDRPERQEDLALTCGSRAEHQERRSVLRRFQVVEAHPVFLAVLQERSPRCMIDTFRYLVWLNEDEDSLLADFQLQSRVSRCTENLWLRDHELGFRRFQRMLQFVWRITGVCTDEGTT